MYYATRFYDEEEYYRTLDLFDSIGVDASTIRKLYRNGIIVFYVQDNPGGHLQQCVCRDGECDECSVSCFRGRGDEMFRRWNLVSLQTFLEIYFPDQVDYVIKGEYEYEPDIVEEDISIMELLVSC